MGWMWVSGEEFEVLKARVKMLEDAQNIEVGTGETSYLRIFGCPVPCGERTRPVAVKDIVTALMRHLGYTAKSTQTASVLTIEKVKKVKKSA